MTVTGRQADFRYEPFPRPVTVTSLAKIGDAPKNKGVRPKKDTAGEGNVAAK